MISAQEWPGIGLAEQGFWQVWRAEHPWAQWGAAPGWVCAALGVRSGRTGALKSGLGFV